MSVYNSLPQAVKKFSHLCKYSKKEEFKDNYERVRIVCKYAHACGAELQSLQNGPGVVQIILNFSTIEMLNHFVSTVGEAVKYIAKK